MAAERTTKKHNPPYPRANLLATILALDHMLNDGITLRPRQIVQRSHEIQRQTHAEEVDEFIDKRSRWLKEHQSAVGRFPDFFLWW